MSGKDQAFSFLGYRQNIPEGKIEFNYRLGSWRFTERLFLPPVTNAPVVVKSILDNLLLILGISYWKLTCSTQIELASLNLSAAQVVFWQTVYTKGLGEFFYRNQIDFRGLVKFPTVNHPGPATLSPFLRVTPEFSKTVGRPATADDSLVCLGSGKDSLVAIELLKRAGKNFTLFTVNEESVQTSLIAKLGHPVYRIRRELDPQLLALNQTGKFYNGHVPISAIYAWLGILAAAVIGKRYLVVANEASSNYGNCRYLKEEINHQWSKSFEFECLFQQYLLKFITPQIIYFSLLRPLTEVKIIKLFANYPQYFFDFVSCNHGKSWCGNCAKCAFIFLGLAAFVPKATVVKIFQKNLLADETLLPLFSQLLGLVGHKPFECVGTPDEAKYAFYLIHLKKEYRVDTVYQKLESQVLTQIPDPEKLKKQLLFIREKDAIPKQFLSVVAGL